MKHAIIYHNPRCSKSRQTRTLLEENGFEIEEVRYLDTPPTVETLDTLCDLLGVAPTEIVRTGEAEFNALGLSLKDNATNRQAWLEILHQHPKLIQRPIVRIGDKAVIGRPPENVLSLF
ncbi:MAG: arsenate reductase (glutaredoxin) [Hydrogenovibrio sp.]